MTVSNFVTSSDLADNVNLDRIRKRALQLISALSAAWVLMPGVFYALNDAQNTAGAVVGTLSFLFLFALWFGLAATDQVQIGVYGLIGTLLVIALITQDTARLNLVLAVLAVSTLVYNRYVVLALYTVLSVLMVWLVQLRISAGQAIELSLNQLSLAVMLGITAVVIRFFLNSIQQNIVLAEENASLLRISAEIGQVTAGIVQLEELLPQSVNFIRDRFGYYHVQIFLLNEVGDVAVLRASTGEAGKKLMAAGHRLNVGSTSVIGRVTQTGQPVKATTGDRGGVHYRNELLPNTRSELALPIKDGERVIGVLDVQSVYADAFDSGQEQALQIMTNLLASAIRNAMFFEQQQKNLAENQRLYIEAEANLQEIERLNRKLTGDNWSRFVAEMEERRGITLRQNTVEHNAEWSQLLREAVQARQPVATDPQETNYTVAVPIILRGEVIGAIEIEPDMRTGESDTIEILRSVSDRLAVSLDNARLFEESQESTLFEQRINTIVGQYQGANSVDELLQITLTELGGTLGAKHGSIRLKPLDRALEANPHSDDITGAQS